MQIAVDISLYPLNADYVPPIKGFIARFSRHPGLTFEYNSLSTQVRGEFEAVFAALKDDIGESFMQADRAVFVIKMVGGGAPPR
jgi:uncharacterized protein YqgV (UPF0045/DUF77 family)